MKAGISNQQGSLKKIGILLLYFACVVSLPPSAGAGILSFESDYSVYNEDNLTGEKLESKSPVNAEI